MCKWVFISPSKPERREILVMMRKNLGEVARDGQSLNIPFRYFMTSIPNFLDKETRLKNVKSLAQGDKINKKQSHGLMKV